tara:strand:+ start:6786 stop:7298 length:513 start_codon:yes stop_codon:yes gene_type:complete
MKFLNKFILFFFLSIISFNSSIANEKTALIDVNYIIQNSNIGKKVLKKIEILNNKNITQLEKKNKELNNLESKIQNKKNIISDEEFNNEVKAFRQKAQDFTNEKNQTVKNFKNFQKKELEKVFKLLNPIISNYMKQNSLNILLDSKNVFMSNNDINITEEILKIINDEIK